VTLAQRIKTNSAGLERLRAARAAELLRDGHGPADAMWRVMTDPALGYSKWRNRARPRKRDRALAAMLDRLMRRAAPELVADARAAAVAVLSSGAVAAASSILRAADGELDPEAPASERTRLKAAELVLESLGVLDRRSGSVAVAIAGGAAGEDASHLDAIREAERILSSEEFTVRDALDPPDLGAGSV
jgi:hypothetical protein